MTALPNVRAALAVLNTQAGPPPKRKRRKPAPLYRTINGVRYRRQGQAYVPVGQS